MQLTVTHHRFGDYLRVRASSSTAPLAVPAGDGVILYLSREDPDILVGCDLEQFSATYSTLEPTVSEALGPELCEEFSRILDSTGSPGDRVAGEDVAAEVLRKPERSLLTTTDPPQSTVDARLNLIALAQESTSLEVSRDDSSGAPSPSAIIRSRFVALGGKLRTSLAETGTVRLDLIRKPVAAMGGSFSEPDPSRLPDRFEVEVGDIRVAFVPEGSMLWASGFVPIERDSGPVSVRISAHLTSEGARIVQPLPDSDPGPGALIADGEVLEDGFFQIHMGSVTSQPGSSALVESCELTFE